MNLSERWIRRPVMTVLVMFGLFFFGLLSYRNLSINNLPDVDFPTISVTAFLPGASPETMAATVATPLEKQFSSLAGIDSMSSSSALGATTINIQFSLDRQIDAAAVDVNSAIAAAMGVLPKDMPNPPTFKKVNPSDMPIMLITLTSDSLPISALHDAGDTILIPNLATINGIAEIDILPLQKYAVRIQVNPYSLANKKIGINEVSDAIVAGNVNLPGGTIDNEAIAYTIDSNGQLPDAKAFEPLVVTYQNGYPLRIRDIGRAVDGIENDRTTAWFLDHGETKGTIVLRVRKQPGANTVDLATAIKERLPRLSAMLPGAMALHLLYDQSEFIRESITDVQITTVLTIFLVIVVIFLFLRSLKTTLIPSLVIPLSLIATFSVMHLLGFTLNTLSLMAITLSIGFVVDDAIVVLENIIRRIESGESALEASIKGSREIGFTVLSMTISLAVVFIPIMFMGGLLGRLFREFAVCITAAILFSGMISLTLTPMLCSRFLGRLSNRTPGRFHTSSERVFNAWQAAYGRSLSWVLRHRLMTLVATLFITLAMVQLFIFVPKGFIPTQDQNFFRIFTLLHDRSSFADLARHQEALNEELLKNPDCREAQVASIAGFSGDNNGLIFVSLKPRADRTKSVDDIINELRPKLNRIPGLIVSLVNPPLIAIGSRLSSAQWQFTLQSSDLDSLYRYGAIMEEKIRTIPALVDVKSDLQPRKPKLEITVDRDKASALGLTLKQIQEAFYSAYGSRQVSTIYTASTFYYVILELMPEFRQNPSSLEALYIKSDRGQLVPLTTVASIRETVSPLTINHAGQVPSATISFNLKPGHSIGTAIDEINRFSRATLPASVHTVFQGSAQAFQSSLASMGFLLLVTVLVIYMVLGILYESFIHPLTILSSLPLAGFGALAALAIFHMELDMYAYVGIIMLVGIVKKNGIMMVDFALEAEKTQGLDSVAAIHHASLIRFRPIMMTTMAALFGCLPIALGLGAGGEARQPLGVAVVGGLFFSQVLTLYVTPVFYVYLDRLNRRFQHGPERTTGSA
ncbi:MAG: efflux RND transporter permease subunit [Kiritimatiellaeota bacterium]|nr:efflux RND transporter permease subunit [Kiritimatiellota bacterium]